jgi:hypothetical protein
LRETVADGPVLLCGLENVHEHVLGPDAGVFAKQLRDPPEQRFLLFRGAGVEHNDLDVDGIRAAGDAIGIAIAKVRGVCSLIVMNWSSSGTFNASRIAR